MKSQTVEKVRKQVERFQKVIAKKSNAESAVGIVKEAIEREASSITITVRSSVTGNASIEVPDQLCRGALLAMCELTLGVYERELDKATFDVTEEASGSA